MTILLLKDVLGFFQSESTKQIFTGRAR